MAVNIGPKIGIEGEATYRKQIQQIVQQSKTLASEMKKLTTSFDENNKSIKQNAEQQKLLQKQITTQKEKINQLNSMLDQSKQKFGENSAKTLKWQEAVNQAEAELNQLENELKSLPSALDLVAQKMSEMGNKLETIGNGMVSLGKTMTTYVTGPIVAGFTAAIKTAGEFDQAMSKVQAISGASATEMSQLRELALYMGKTTVFSAREAAEGLTYMGMAGWKSEDMIQGLPGILNLAAASQEELGTTSDIVTDALTAFNMEASESARFADILASAATNSNTTVSMMGESFKYAAPVAGALAYSAEDVAIALGLMANSGIKADMAGTSLRNMFQRMAKPTKESQMAMDRLGISLTDGQGNMKSFRQIMDELREGFVEILMPMDEYNAALDNLDAQLESGELTEKKYEAALEELNKQAFGAEGAEKARAAAMLGGARAMSGLLAIANASEEDYQKLTKAIDDSSQAYAMLEDGSVVPLSKALEEGQTVLREYSGAAEAMAAVMLDNLPGQVTLLKSGIEGLAISIGNLLMPTVRKIVAEFQNWVDMFNGLSDEEKMQIVKMGAIAASIGPVLMVVGKLVIGISKLMQAAPAIATAFQGIGAALGAITGPVALIIAAIGALVAAFLYLWNTNEQFRANITATWNQIVTTVQTFITQLTTKLASIGITWESVTTAIKTAWDGLCQMLAPVFEGALQGILATLTIIFDGILAAVDMVIAVLNGDAQLFLTSFTTFISTLWTLITTWMQIIFTTIMNVVNVILSFFGTSLSQLYATIMTTLNNVKTFIVVTLQTIWAKIVAAVTQILESVSEKMAEIKEEIISKLEEVCDFISSLPDRFFSWGQEMMQNLAAGIESGIDWVGGKIELAAEKIASFLHFSEPDVGPLSHFNDWMPDMMSQMAAQIEAGRYQVQVAAGHVAADIAAPIAGSQAMTMNNTFTFNGGYTEADGREIVRQINRQLGAIYM